MPSKYAAMLSDGFAKTDIGASVPPKTGRAVAVPMSNVRNTRYRFVVSPGSGITLETAMSSVPKNVVSALVCKAVGNCMKRTVSGVVLKPVFGTLINGTPASTP